ncbi:MAG: sigma 54-interacting transcriptional regulator [Blastocatellia bacterium]
MSPAETKNTLSVQEKISLGEAALRRNADQEASRHFSEILETDLPTEQECIVRCMLSKCLENMNQYREALKVLNKYEQTGAKDELSIQVRGNVNLRLGWVYSWLGDHPRAIALLNQALKEFKDIGFESGVGEAYHALGRTYIVEIEEYKIARDHLLEAIDYQRRAGDTHALAQTYLRLGLIDYQEGQLTTAKENFLGAINLAESSTDHILQGALQINLAAVYFDQCEIEAATKSYELAIEHLEKVGHKRLLGVAYSNLGKNLIRLGNWKEAQEILTRGLNLSKEAKNRRDEAIALQTLGYLHYFQEKYDLAEQELSLSIDLLMQIKTKTPLAESFRYLALVLLAKAKHNEAFDYAKRALQLTFNSKVTKHAAISYLVLAEMHLEKKEYRTAEDFLKMARAKLEKQTDLELSGYSQRLLGRTRAAMGDLSGARYAVDQSISCFNTTRSVYQTALSQLELARILYKLGDIVLAETNLLAAKNVFIELQVTKLQERSAKLFSELPRQGVVAAEKTLAPVNFDSFLIERLMEATHQRELLLRELTAIARDLMAASTVIIFEITETTDFNPIISQGNPLSNIARIYDKIRLQLNGSRALAPEHIIKEFSDREQKLLLYVVAAQAPNERRLSQLNSIVRLAEQSLEVNTLRERIKTTKDFDPTSLRCLSSMSGFLVASPAMKSVLSHIHKIRSNNVTVLITGESGTGKELIARAVHLESERRDRDFVPFNCAAVAKDIVESRLFGHRKGAFTGATSDQRGVVRAAEGGTLFLDEIGELPLDIQPKLLRFLQEGEVHALGDDRPAKVNVRVLAATNRDLEKQVSLGLFREDLFHRLNVIRIQIPPLRERREEILPLAESFLKTFAERMDKSVKFSEEVADKLLNYNWPGNIRQLQNEIERIVAYADDKHIAVLEDLSPEILNFQRQVATRPEWVMLGKTGAITIPRNTTLAEAIDEVERQILTETLKRHENNISRTARELGLTRRGLHLKCGRLGIDL